jgi:hypothetical protein
MKLWPTILAYTLAVTACHHSDEGGGGGSGGGGGQNTGGAGAGSSACEQTAPLYCQRYFMCFPEDAQFSYGTEHGCEVDDAMTCHILGTLSDVDKMAVERWAACNRSLSLQACDGFLSRTPLPECAVHAGTRPAGKACVDGSQCVTKFCKVSPAMEPTSPEDLHVCGICAPTPAPGDPCVEWNDCGELACSGGKCTVPQKAGAACADSDGCDTNLVCFEGTCGPPRMAGETCTDFECAIELRCVAGKCAPGVPAGQACTESCECESYNCGNDNVCKEDVPTEPPIAPGRPCTPGGTACQGGSYCDGVSGLCKLYQRMGEPCARNRECAFLLTCQAGQCQPVSDAICQ